MRYLFGLIFMEVVADIFAKKYGTTKYWGFFVLSLLGYVLANTSWLIFMAKQNKLALGANVFSVSTGLVATLIGVGLFGETLTPTQYVGVLLGATSLILLL